MLGERIIDFNTSNEQIIESYYNILSNNLNNMDNPILNGKYVFTIIDLEGMIVIQVAEASNRSDEFIKEESDVEQFRKDAENITITLVKKERLEELMKQMQGG